jgi:putative flippase GtrA
VPRALDRALEWAKSHEGRKILRFTSVSAISTVVSFTSIAVLYGFHIIKGVIWATVTGNLIASVPSYWLNRTWTWGKHGRSHLTKEILPFWGMTGLGIGVSMVGAAWARHEVHTHHWAHLVNTALVAFTNLASFGLFWILKIIVFNRIFRVHPLEEIDEHLRVEETRDAAT